MANDFINTITTKDGTAYDVQDKRLTVTAADAGKVVSVDENGNLTLTSGGTKLYKHEIQINGDWEDPLIIISNNPTPIVVGTVIYFQYGVVNMYYRNKFYTMLFIMPDSPGQIKVEGTDALGNPVTVIQNTTTFEDVVTQL